MSKPQAIDNLLGFIGEVPIPRHPTGSDAFNEMVKDAPLPWDVGTGLERWSIVDANGDSVCCFDGSAPESKMLMVAVIVAVNTCGGFRAEVAEKDAGTSAAIPQVHIREHPH